MTDSKADAAGITITRTFDAPRAVVFEAWTTPKHFAVWFGGTASEIPVESVAMDVRAGGTWKATMLIGPERNEMPWYGEYLEVDPPARLVMTLADFTSGEKRDVLTITFDETATGKTEMRSEQRGGNLTAEQYDQAREGWEVFFDTMADLLAQA
jgi:uncharacterized protein YndB with AHSA1/START domain